MEQYSSFGDAGPRTQSPAPHTGSLYELGEVLGSGGAGTVYRGTQVRLQRPVAIKEIRQIFEVFASLDRSSLSARFAEIVRAQSQLGHPHILRTIDVEVDGEYPRVVMELAPGGNLRRVIERRDQAALSVRLKYLFQVLHALRHAHEAGVTHGGLKPENVLLDAAGNALVTDFGMGQLVDREGGGNQVFVGVGTLSYMSPEQFRRPSHSSVKSDLYSLGIMFYEMLTGKVPGRRSPMPSSFHPDIPRKVDDIFDRMSMDDPAERYATADEVLDDLYGSSEVMGLLDGRGGFVFERSPLAGAAAPGSVQPAVESEPSPAMGEPSAPDGAAEDGDVLGKLNKYGRMFDEE